MPSEPSLRAVIEDLERALALEKALLLEGRYEELAAVGAEKSRLAALFDRMLVAPSGAAQASGYRKRLAGVVAKAQENEALLRSARLGAASAQARIKEIMSRQRTIGVYAETGDKPLVPNACVTRQKLA